MKGGAEPPFILNHPAAAALSAEPKAEGPAAKPPGGGAEPPFLLNRPAAAALSAGPKAERLSERFGRPLTRILQKRKKHLCFSRKIGQSAAEKKTIWKHG